MLLAIGIFVATITLVIWQPRGLGIGWSAISHGRACRNQQPPDDAEEEQEALDPDARAEPEGTGEQGEGEAPDEEQGLEEQE